MKKLLVIIAFLLTPLFSYSQNASYDITKETMVQDWRIPPGLPDQVAGRASFSFAVTRLPNFRIANGQYYFKIYFFSGSYYNNGIWAGTYMEDISIYVDGQIINKVSWLMFKGTYTSSTFHFYSHYLNPSVSLGWQSIRIN